MLTPVDISLFGNYGCQNLTIRSKKKRKAHVIEFFKSKGKNQTYIAKILGMGRASVSVWSDVIPEVHALKLERLTNGELKYDPSLYESNHRQTA